MKPAIADQTYDVSGIDQYRIGTTAQATNIAYSGAQLLTIDKTSNETRYVASVRYTRVDDTGKASVRARFVQSLAAGSFEDKSDDDPDFLTVLNQPFAIQLEATTMRDLRTMRAKVPFTANSPLGNSTLKGYLRPSAGGRITGHSVIGVRFTATGPMSGTIRDKNQANVSGTITMDGTAYYATDSALLLGLDATLTINGNLSDATNNVPVAITYRRVIRANADTNAWNTAAATPLRRH